VGRRDFRPEDHSVVLDSGIGQGRPPHQHRHRAGPNCIRKGDTLIDLARYYDLGCNESSTREPRHHPWVPPVGATILLPILPCCYEGLVVNIPVRLFLYRRSAHDPGRRKSFYPVGLGRDDWQTPAEFKVRGKTVNPTWNIPESIRKEHIAERNDPRTSIPGGAEDNPLGKYRIELTLPLYGIHRTDIPWGVGMQVSHGCVRLYPEDIERLFPLVPVGLPGEFSYQRSRWGCAGRDRLPDPTRHLAPLGVASGSHGRAQRGPPERRRPTAAPRRARRLGRHAHLVSAGAARGERPDATTTGSARAAHCRGES
jgi:hypothetical protein